MQKTFFASCLYPLYTLLGTSTYLGKESLQKSEGRMKWDNQCLGDPEVYDMLGSYGGGFF
jgi:hypothetical protein